MARGNIIFSSFLLFLFLVLSASTTSDARQGEYLSRLMKAKKAKIVDDSGVFDVETVELERAIVAQKRSKAADKIHRLPGQPDVDFDQYGGYVTVDEKAGRALFYYFAEAMGPDPSSKPLVLWLNGGPGCSSLGYGAMVELGPFRVMSDGKTLYANKFAWNRVANVLFLESPAGVGFSYSNSSSDYRLNGDKRTARDNYIFLLNWLERFPEYKKRDFFLAGESYAGHYVPQLAHTIVQHNKLAKKTIINLKGLIIGNAAINDETDSRGMYDYFWNHDLISDETIHDIHKYCNFSSSAQSRQCGAAGNQVDQNIEYVDIYNIYAPLCQSENLTAHPKRVSIMNYDECSDVYVEAYLRRPEVQHALHANVTKIPQPWSACGLASWADSPSSVMPLFNEFSANGLRVWVFSGDLDGRVPITSTKYSLKTLNLEVKTPWQPWYLKNHEVGGYTTVYKNGLTLATVRGAGHMVPSYQPIRALSLINHFLKGKPLAPAVASGKSKHH